MKEKQVYVTPILEIIEFDLNESIALSTEEGGINFEFLWSEWGE